MTPVWLEALAPVSGWTGGRSGLALCKTMFEEAHVPLSKLMFYLFCLSSAGWSCIPWSRPVGMEREGRHHCCWVLG